MPNFSLLDDVAFTLTVLVNFSATEKTGGRHGENSS
jgi:hypothetical protein